MHRAPHWALYHVWFQSKSELYIEKCNNYYLCWENKYVAILRLYLDSSCDLLKQSRSCQGLLLSKQQEINGQLADLLWSDYAQHLLVGIRNNMTIYNEVTIPTSLMKQRTKVVMKVYCSHYPASSSSFVILSQHWLHMPEIMYQCVHYGEE